MSKNYLITKNMSTFNFEEAIYGALCYIAGNNDKKISRDEFAHIKPKFLELHFLPNNKMDTISTKWAQNTSKFLDDVIASLNNCSYTEKLEAFRTICIVLNNWAEKSPSYFSSTDRWDPANEIRKGMNISHDEYNRYLNWFFK